MHKITKQFYSQNKWENLNEDNWREISRKRSQSLKDMYKGETAIILTCGPSLDQVYTPEFEKFISDKLVISVKQSLKLRPEICDFHLYNEVRMEDYNYAPETIRLSCSQFLSDFPSHIHHPIHSYKYPEAVFVTNEYSRWCMRHSYTRPWGIGIMFETGLFLPALLGCKKVLIIGFDMNSKGKYHYYDPQDSMDSQHYKVDKEEFEYCQSTIPHYLNWAEENSLEVALHSPLSALPIKQIEDYKQWV